MTSGGNDSAQFVADQTQTEQLYSCDRCRQLKIKCSRRLKGSPCDKCMKTGKVCEVTRSRQPKNVIQKQRTRVADVDEKLSDILKLLRQSEAAKPSSPSSVRSQQGAHATRLASPVSVNIRGDFPRLPASSMLLKLPTTVLQHLLNKYRERQSYFPFVIVADDWTLTSMAAERPFLLMATITCASSTFPHLQAALSNELRECLARRVIVNGEKDLDLLQGLLVYLAWFHYYSRSRCRDAYRYLQLAISMVVDLCLDNNPGDLAEHRHDIFLDRPLLRDLPDLPVEIADLDAQRTYLGCCIVSSAISYFLGKPNALAINDHAISCARYIQKRNESEWDHMLLPIIKLQMIAEEVDTSYKKTRGLSDEQRRQLVYQEHFFGLKLEKWRNEMAFDIRQLDLLYLKYLGVKVMVHEIGQIHRFGRCRLTMSNVHTRTDIGDATPLCAALQNCLVVAGQYLTRFLALTKVTVHILPFEEWARLTLACFIVYKLLVGVKEVPEWDPEVAQHEFDLEQLLTQLSKLVASPYERVESFETMYHLFPKILDSSKTAYRLLREHPSMFPQGIRTHDTEDTTSQNSKIPPAATRCPGFQHLATSDQISPNCSADGLSGEAIQEVKALEQQLADSS